MVYKQVDAFQNPLSTELRNRNCLQNMAYVDIRIVICLCLWKLCYLVTEASNLYKPTKLFSKIGNYKSNGQLVTSVSVKAETECAWICSLHTSCISYNVIHGSDGLRCDVNRNALDTLIPVPTTAYHGKD